MSDERLGPGGHAHAFTSMRPHVLHAAHSFNLSYTLAKITASALLHFKSQDPSLLDG